MYSVWYSIVSLVGWLDRQGAVLARVNALVLKPFRSESVFFFECTQREHLLSRPRPLTARWTRQRLGGVMLEGLLGAITTLTTITFALVTVMVPMMMMSRWGLWFRWWSLSEMNNVRLWQWPRNIGWNRTQKRGEPAMAPVRARVPRFIILSSRSADFLLHRARAWYRRW